MDVDTRLASLAAISAPGATVAHRPTTGPADALGGPAIAGASARESHACGVLFVGLLMLRCATHITARMPPQFSTPTPPCALLVCPRRCHWEYQTNSSSPHLHTRALQPATTPLRPCWRTFTTWPPPCARVGRSSHLITSTPHPPPHLRLMRQRNRQPRQRIPTAVTTTTPPLRWWRRPPSWRSTRGPPRCQRASRVAPGRCGCRVPSRRP